MGLILSTQDDIFWTIALSSIVTIGIIYFVAGYRILKTLKGIQEHESNVIDDNDPLNVVWNPLPLWKPEHLRWLPLVCMLFGIMIAVMPICISAILIATLYAKIPYALSIDFAIVLGMGLAFVFGYVHWGKMKFLHKV